MMRGWGYGYGPMMGGGALIGFLILLFWLLIVAGIIILIVWLVRRSGHEHGQHMPPGGMQPPSGMQHPTGVQPPASTPVGTAYPPTPPAAQPPARDEACEIARGRYARGEIDKAEYEDICKTLQGS